MDKYLINSFMVFKSNLGDIKMRKNSQTINLTNWYAIDSILFGDRKPKDIMSEGEHKNYLIAKGAALSNLFEVYVKLNYEPVHNFSSGREIMEFGGKRGVLAKERAAQILTTKGISEIPWKLKPSVIKS